MTYSVCISILY